MTHNTGIRLSGNMAPLFNPNQAQKSGKSLAEKLEQSALIVGKLDQVAGIDFNSKPGVVKIHIGDVTARAAFDDQGKVQSFAQRKDPRSDQWEDDSMYFQGAKIHKNSNDTISYTRGAFKAEPDSRYYNYVTEKARINEDGKVTSYHHDTQKTFQDTPQRRAVPQWVQEWNLSNPAERHGF